MQGPPAAAGLAFRFESGVRGCAGQRDASTRSVGGCMFAFSEGGGTSLVGDVLPEIKQALNQLSS
jgi:hypothetical protein